MLIYSSGNPCTSTKYYMILILPVELGHNFIIQSPLKFPVFLISKPSRSVVKHINAFTHDQCYSYNGVHHMSSQVGCLLLYGMPTTLVTILKYLLKYD